MSDETLKNIADNANIIIAGFAFTLIENDIIRVLNLNNPTEACVLDLNGDMLETTMDDNMLCMIQAYFLRNREFLEVENA